MWVRKKEVEQLSEFVKGYISGEELDIRDHREGIFNILKNLIELRLKNPRKPSVYQRNLVFYGIFLHGDGGIRTHVPVISR